MNAAHCGNLKIIKLLCEMKANVECQSAVRMMCVFDVLDVSSVKCPCSYLLRDLYVLCIKKCLYYAWATI